MEAYYTLAIMRVTNKPNVYNDNDIDIKKKSGFFQEHSVYDYFDMVPKVKRKIRLAS
jgi:hypothetical protein